jgi:rhodanese-related sulfurtransferase
LRRHRTICVSREGFGDDWSLFRLIDTIAEAGGDGIELDVRTPDQYAEAHLPSAISLPHGRINERNLADYPAETVFFTYCAGSFCNAADKRAAHLARLDRPVKKMIGGISGWVEEVFELVSENVSL